MNPAIMTALLLVGWGVFTYSAWRRWRLMMIGRPEARFDRVGERLRLTWEYAFAQHRMRRYPLAGAAHMVIFLGFIVLLLRSLILWGRGYDESFCFWVFGPDHVPGKVYGFLKDIFAVLVIVGACVFLYLRVIKRLGRLTLNYDGLIILGIILTMMVADITYDGASLSLRSRAPTGYSGVVVTPRSFAGELHRREVISWVGLKDDQENVLGKVPASTYRDLTPEELAALEASLAFHVFEPAGSMLARMIIGLPDGALKALKHVGFWTHSALVLIFLNILPYSKHFHIITAIPNVFTQDLRPSGRLPPIEDIEGKLERDETLGVRRIDQFSWKAILDFYTCTECGRCSDHCPATKTGKKLSPKHFTVDLRNFLYQHQEALIAPGGNGAGRAHVGGALPYQKDLVDGVIDPEVLWACTTCRACEQECPVSISFVDKIVDMRRYLVQERGDFPNQLQAAFRGLEANANPWSFPPGDRARWAEGLGVKTLADQPNVAVIFWVGCMPSFDERAKKVARATAQLMQKAGVDFAMLGTEEQCTGDPARRAGNEYLFQMFAKANVDVLNRYEASKKKIVTTCPHCFNTLLNEYPDFGGRYDVVHHSTFLARLLNDGLLTPARRIDKKVVYHDSCYLGRYNEVYDAPRQALQSIPGLVVLEPLATRDRGMCCGAGGAQMFKEEEPGSQRVNIARTQQLLDTHPDAVASACPFCQRMLTDGLAAHGREEVPQVDIAELLWEGIEAPLDEPGRAA